MRYIVFMKNRRTAGRNDHAMLPVFYPHTFLVPRGLAINTQATSCIPAKEAAVHGGPAQEQLSIG